MTDSSHVPAEPILYDFGVDDIPVEGWYSHQDMRRMVEAAQSGNGVE